VDLLDRILVINPAKRPSAVDLLNDKFFWLDPPPLKKEE
jgi:serine/threonine protein kinase